MSAWFTRCCRAVVASQAGTRRQANVAKRRIRPNRGFVATVAFGGGRNVRGRFCHCSHAVAGSVTTCTIPWCSLEHALNMAGAAPGLGVRTGKVEPRLNMIKFYSGWIGCLRPSKMGNGKQWQHEHEHYPTR